MSLMSQADFARHMGATPSYITQLKTAGRLVMQGAMVNVEASKQRIEDTKDPSKAGVADRHGQEREQKSFDSDASAPLSTGQDRPQSAGPSINDITGKAGSVYQQSRAMKEKYNAMQAKIAYEKEVGILLVAADAKAAVADGDAIIRNRLESLPDMLAPQLAAENDEQKIRAMLMDHIEHVLGELSRSFHNLIKQN